MTLTDAHDRVNLVPLIDCMFFLILFFLLVMRFTPDEQAIASLLPTSGGSALMPTREEIVREVAIVIVPAGLPRGAQPSAYAALVAEQRRAGDFAQRVELRVGGSPGIELDTRALSGGAGDAAAASELQRAHRYLTHELADRERAGADRSAQPRIVIAACSALPWSAAIVALDGVRAYERSCTVIVPVVASALALARRIDFTAPPLGHSPRDLGDELYQLVNRR